MCFNLSSSPISMNVWYPMNPTMKKRSFIYVIATFLASNLAQGKYVGCHCAYGGLCIKYKGSWLNEPCHCSEINTPSRSPRYEGQSCSTLKKYCTISSCNNQPNKCQEAGGYALCQCGSQYLLDCTIPPKGYLSGIIVYYTTIQMSWERSLLVVFQATPKFSGNHEIIVKYDKNQRLTRVLNNPNAALDKCDPLFTGECIFADKDIYDAQWCGLPLLSQEIKCVKFTLELPIELNHVDNIATKSRHYPLKVAGRNVQVDVEVKVDGYSYFSKSFSLFFDYDPAILQCARKVKAEGCNEDYKTPMVHQSSKQIVLSASLVPYFDCPTLETSTILWNVYEGVFANTNTRLPEFTSQGEKKIIEPYSLPVNTYKITITGILKGSVTYYAGTETHKQVAHCYISLSKGKMSFDIVGGNRRVNCVGSVSVELVNQNLNFPDSELDFTWRCTNFRSSRDIACRQEKKGKGPHLWNLKCGNTYSVMAIITHPQYGKFEAKAELGAVEGASEIQLVCTSCGNVPKVNRNTKIILKATETPFTANILWTCLCNGRSVNLDRLREPSTPHNIREIRPNSYSEGASCKFIAETKKGKSELTIQINTPPKGGSCEIKPTSGFRGLTDFNMTCNGWEDDDTPIKYLVFEIYPDRKELKFTSDYPNIISLQLFSENIEVLIQDSLSLYVVYNLSIKLEYPGTEQALEPYIEEIKKKFKYKDYEGFLAEAQYVSQLLEPEGLYPNGYKVTLLKMLNKLDTLNILSHTEFTAQILYRYFNSTPSNEYDSDLVELGGSEMVATFVDKAKNLMNVSVLKLGTQNTDNHIMKLDILLVSNKVAYYKSPKFNYTTSDIQLVEMHKRRRKRSMQNVVKGLEAMSDLVSQVPEPLQEKPFELHDGHLTVWSKADRPNELTSHLEALAQRGHPSIQFSQSAKSFYSNQTLSVNMIALDEDVFTWSKHGTSSQVVEFTFKNYNNETLTPIIEPRGPFYIILPIKSLDMIEIKGTATLALSGCVQHRDRSVSVHHLVVPPGIGEIEISVPPSYFDKIKIWAYHLKRPDFKMISSRSPPKVARFRVPYNNTDERLESDFYIGIISMNTTKVNYTITATVFRCLIWSQDDWRSDVCSFIGLTRNNTALNCSCSHLSFFSAQMFLPPNTLVLSEDIYLFANILDNVYVAVLVATILLLYFSTVIWGILKDRKEKMNRFVIHLDDNYPGDTVFYVVAVYTSPRCAAGTTSRVAIQVIGEESKSRVHILRANGRRTLMTSMDNWFVMYTKKTLGKPKQIILWHDNTGSSPDWCCMRIVVYDLPTKTQYLFPAERWFQVTENQDESQNATLDSFKPDTVKRDTWFSFISGHTTTNLREKHHWASIFIRHPRSLYTRSERATIATGFLITSMLASMLFFGISDVGPSDSPMFQFSLQNFIYSLEATVISTVLTFLIVFFFEKSKKKIKGLVDDIQEYDGEHIQKKKEPETHSAKAKKLAYKMAKNKFVEPVPYKPVVSDPMKLKEGFNIWLLFAWISAVSTILVCSFFVVLYGLKFGVKKSLIWMATFMLSVFSDLLVSNPFQLVVAAVLVAYLFKTSTLEAFTLDVDYDSKAPRQNVQERLNQAVLTRTRSEYKPMLLKNIQKIGWKRTVKRARNEICFASAILLLLCVSVSLIMYYFGITSIYYNNLQLATQFSENISPLGVDIDKVYTEIEFYNYLQYSSIPLLHRIRWYNNKTLMTEGNEIAEVLYNISDLQGIASVKGFVVDYSSKLLGVPRLRQQRLPVDSMVNVPEVFQTWYPKAMYGILTSEDEKDYLPAWQPYDPKVRKFSRSELWWYLNKYNAETGQFQGKSGNLFKGTGYPTELYWSLANSTWKVTDLSADEWIDNRTRSVFLEINLYNVNSNLFTSLTVVAEVLPSGLFSAKLSIETASIQFSTSFNELGILILTVVVVLILLVNVINAMYYLSRKGFTAYVANWSGLNNLALIGVGLWFISVFFTRFLYFVIFSDKLDAAPKNVYTSLYPAFNYNFFAHCVTGCFIIVITSITITRIHALIGYSKFRKALDMTKFTLIILFMIIILFSYLISMLCFYFGTLFVERLAILFILRAIPFTTIEQLYRVRVSQIILYVGLIIFILILFNKASQIYYYSRASAMFKKETLGLAMIVAGIPSGKEKSDNVMKKRLNEQLATWKKRRRSASKLKRGGTFWEDESRRAILRFNGIEALDAGRRPPGDRFNTFKLL